MEKYQVRYSHYLKKCLKCYIFRKKQTYTTRTTEKLLLPPITFSLFNVVYTKWLIIKPSLPLILWLKNIFFCEDFFFLSKRGRPTPGFSIFLRTDWQTFVSLDLVLVPTHSLREKGTKGQRDKGTKKQRDKRTKGQTDKRTNGQTDKRNLGSWEHGKLGSWELGNLGTWELGNLGT